MLRQYDIKRTEFSVVHNNSMKVLMPGDFVEIYADELKSFNGEVAIEPRVESPLSGNWPEPSISQGTVQIPNLSYEPIILSKCQHSSDSLS